MRKIFIYGIIFLSLFLVSSCGEVTKTATPVETPTPIIENTYDISFENNGYGVKPNSIEDVKVIPQWPVLSDEGYNFLGWFTDEQMTKAANEG